METLAQMVTEYGPAAVLVLRALQAALAVAREARELRRERGDDVRE